jgi:dihydrofolate reductase
MRISIIVAVAANGIIGRDNDLPWHLSADLKRFKRLTMGHHLLMGRKTFEAIGRPLPGRHMIVISRGRPELPAGIARVSSLAAGLDLARRAGEEEVFVAGGAQIYRLALPLADRVHMTRVHREFAGDADFPDLDITDWAVVDREDHAADEMNPLDYSFILLERH